MDEKLEESAQAEITTGETEEKAEVTSENKEAVNQEEAAKSPENEAQEEAEDYSVYRKLLVFAVGERKFSVDSECVDEIVNYTDVYPLPFVPASVEGVINLRGQPVTVFNPFVNADFKGIKSLKHCNILKFKCDDEAFGIKISTVENFSPENKTDGIEELNVDKIKADLRNALGYENN